ELHEMLDLVVEGTRVGRDLAELLDRGHHFRIATLHELIALDGYLVHRATPVDEITLNVARTRTRRHLDFSTRRLTAKLSTEWPFLPADRRERGMSEIAEPERNTEELEPILHEETNAA